MTDKNIKEIKGSCRSKKIRHSGHFVDQILKSANPSKRPSLLELIGNETKEKITQSGVEVRTEGVRLTPPQDKLIHALMRLLSEKSENQNEKSERFYSGNLQTLPVLYGGKGQQSLSPVMRIYPSELYRAYLDSDDYSGEEIKYIKSLIQDTEQQKFIIIYDRKYNIAIKKGLKESRTDRIEDYQTLFKILSFFEGLTNTEKNALDRGNEAIRELRGELIIALNPLLVDQIRSKYVEYPADINRRTTIAAGGHRQVTESVIALRDYCLRELSVKRKKFEINEENLFLILKLENYMRSKRKKLIAQRVQSAIQAVKNLGLIASFERVIGSAGQWKYAFHLNQEFE